VYPDSFGRGLIVPIHKGGWYWWRQKLSWNYTYQQYLTSLLA